MPKPHEILAIQAQADWTNRADEVHSAQVIAGIQIGYDRAIALIKAHAAHEGPVKLQSVADLFFIDDPMGDMRGRNV